MRHLVTFRGLCVSKAATRCDLQHTLRAGSAEVSRRGFGEGPEARADVGRRGIVPVELDLERDQWGEVEPAAQAPMT